MKSKTRRCRYLNRPATRIVSLILSFVILFSITVGIDLSVFANTSGDYEYTVLNDGTVKITDYKGSATELVIPSVIDGHTVTIIGCYAFRSCSSLTGVVIPNSVKSIETSAFEWCPSLISVKMANSVISIEEGAFKCCESLINVTMSNNLESIGNYAFGWCPLLTSIEIPNSVTSIGYDAFGECSSLTSINVDVNNKNYSSQDGVLFNKEKTELIQYPIGNTRTLYKVPNSVTHIGWAAFDECKSLTSVEIPNSVTFIEDYAFYDCEFLNDVYYSGTKEQWDIIDIEYGNTYLKNANIYFNSSAPVGGFCDLDGFDSYKDFVAYTSVYNSFLKGTNPPYFTEFSPTAPITRAMFVTILYRMAGEPYVNSNPYRTSPFTDITDTSVYYYDAACWALKNGITTETTFKPFDNVSREQTASFLFRYAQKNGKLGNDAYKNVNLSSYPDYNSVHGWAVEAMQWANYNGMITGTQQGYINPQGATQRIHATKILYGFGKVCNIGNFE